MKKFRVALVHDDLVQWGGAERVLVKMAEILPTADIYTSVWDKDNKIIASNIDPKRIQVSFMQRVPFWKKFYRAMVFLYPFAFESFDFSNYDLVISQTTRFAKNIITGDNTLHICYCHTPPRFLWGFSNQQPLPKWILPLLSFGRIIDQISSNRVDIWLAGSKNAKNRIKKVYKVSSNVLYPFAEDKFFKTRKISDKGYFLVIARLVKYKKVDEVIKACLELGTELVVVGSGPMKNDLLAIASSKVKFYDKISDERLMDLMSKCKGVIISAEEDFGLVSIEAQAMGKGVIAFRAGGSLESIKENASGVFFDSQNSEEIKKAINRFKRLKISTYKTRKNARRFSERVFKKQFIATLAKFGYSFL